MKKVVVVYTSKYGHTQTYAKMIAEKLKCECMDLQNITVKDIKDYDVVIYGAPVYDKQILFCYKLLGSMGMLKTNPIVIFACGMMKDTEEYLKILRRANFKEYDESKIKFFYYQAGFSNKNLNSADKMFFSTYMKDYLRDDYDGYYAKLKKGSKRNFTNINEKYITELVEYVKSLL